MSNYFVEVLANNRLQFALKRPPPLDSVAPLKYNNIISFRFVGCFDLTFNACFTFSLFFCCFLFIRRVKKFFSCATTTSGMTSPRPCQDFQVFILFFESSTALYNSRIPTVLKTSHKRGQNILFHSTLNCCFSIVPLFVTRKPIIIKQYVPFSYFVFLFILFMFRNQPNNCFISPLVYVMLCFFFLLLFS